MGIFGFQANIHDLLDMRLHCILKGDDVVFRGQSKKLLDAFDEYVEGHRWV